MWQPIETAPKDGTLFIGNENGFDYGLPRRTQTEMRWVLDERYVNKGFFEDRLGRVCHPDYWMPRPLDPAP